MKFAEGIQELADHGLNIFLSAKVTDLPENLFSFSHEQKNKTLCLLGHGGTSLWEKLPHPILAENHPIDHYTKEKIQIFAEKALENDIEVLYPNEDYTIPLQKFGRALNLCSQSPIGLDINSEFGLWFAFRGIFLTSKPIPIVSLEKMPSPCETCLSRPCLNFSDTAFARLHCPVKTEHQYSQKQQNFHQNASNLLKI